MINDVPISVWLDDTSALFRLGLAACLDSAGFRVVGESARFTPPPPAEGVNVLIFELTEAALEPAGSVLRSAGSALVATVERPDDSLIGTAVALGVVGILIRDEITPESLIHCIRSVAVGNASFPMGALLAVVGSGNGATRRGAPDQLTSRELDVLRLLAEGKNVREVAGTLAYCEKTVKNTVHDLLLRTGFRNREEAIAVLTKQGLI